MKKIILFVSILILSGCALPFTSPSKSDSVHYINKTTDLLVASSNLHKQIIEEINAAEEEGVEFSVLIQQVWQMKNSQQEIYESLKNRKIPYKNDEIQLKVLELVNNRISTYNQLMNALDQEEYKLVNASIETAKAKDEEYESVLLKEQNKILEEIKVNKKKELYEMINAEKTDEKKKEK